MRSRETQVEVIAHFARDQREPIPLRVKIIEQGESVVVKVAYVRNLKYVTHECIEYECYHEARGQMRAFKLMYWVRDMEWHIVR